MHLLNTSTGELRQFSSSKNVKYAILSHIWQESPKEQTYHDVREIIRQCKEPRENGETISTLSMLSNKIRACCRIARNAGHEWIWIDTCCIDNNSSAELSEAINSMFTWYADAQVCYAYLHDVGDDEDPSRPGSAFRRSVWHTRGWTLQELLAPACVVFLSRSWRTLGSKYSLALALVDITGIRHDVLTRKQSDWLEKASVAERMSWAAKRRTTRVEDRAYSLMGIFGINMPTIYGEGPRAFIRLQEEILRRIPDQSIFAWGAIHPDFTVASTYWTALEDEGGVAYEGDHGPVEVDPRIEDLLASSPSDFDGCAGIKVLSMPDFETRLGIAGKVPQYTFTSYGMLVQLNLSTNPVDGGMAWAARTCQQPVSRPIYAAILACSTQAKQPIIIILRPSPNAASPQYSVGEFVKGKYYRCALHPDLILKRFRERARTADWNLKEIYIRHDFSTLAIGQPGSARVEKGVTPMFTFHMPQWRLNSLLKRHRLVIRAPVADGLILRLPYKTNNGQLEHATITLQVVHEVLKEVLTIRIGVGCACTLTSDAGRVRENPINDFWVDVRVARVAAPGHTQLVGDVLPCLTQNVSEVVPDCKRAHLRSVETGDVASVLQFGDHERKVEVTIDYADGFDPVGADMHTSYVLALDLSGTMYDAVHGSGVDAPIPADPLDMRATGTALGLVVSTEDTSNAPLTADGGGLMSRVVRRVRHSLSSVLPLTPIANGKNTTNSD